MTSETMYSSRRSPLIGRLPGEASTAGDSM
jgi:hypothetical protein